MKLYRIVDDNELESALTNDFFDTSWQYYEKDQGWATFDGYSYMNTFTYDQNQNLHFFPFAIDAVQYLYLDRKKAGETYNGDACDSFCVFDIPDKLLEKGYGFYPNKVTPEYVAKESISKQYLVWYTKNKQKMFEEILENIEEIVKWYSTVGKSHEMILDNGLSFMNIAGVRTKGGFIYSFGKWFSNVLLDFVTEENEKEIMRYCYDVNEKCYKDLDFIKDKTVLLDTQNKYRNGEIKNPQEMCITFKQLENKYSHKDIAIGLKSPILVAK